ncbi:6738_t:CDS:2 [Diversispora eburnea]|uniref:6738_t:CDS:1 n=1 Tax=Diversispora eburnea TaxID=1213867 RepID=A0A9N8VCF6_9GLOM|nr:6738_t:CDS:2 [Diversispora eburnea]
MVYQPRSPSPSQSLFSTNEGHGWLRRRKYDDEVSVVSETLESPLPARFPRTQSQLLQSPEGVPTSANKVSFQKLSLQTSLANHAKDSSTIQTPMGIPGGSGGTLGSLSREAVNHTNRINNPFVRSQTPYPFRSSFGNTPLQPMETSPIPSINGSTTGGFTNGNSVTSSGSVIGGGSVGGGSSVISSANRMSNQNFSMNTNIYGFDSSGVVNSVMSPSRKVEKDKVDTALVQSTPYPKPRQQPISTVTPKKNHIPYQVRELLIQQELPKNKYQDLVNNNVKLLLIYIGSMAFIFFLPFSRIQSMFEYIELFKHEGSTDISYFTVYGVKTSLVLYLAFRLFELCYINYLWNKEEKRIMEIRERIEKELGENGESRSTSQIFQSSQQSQPQFQYNTINPIITTSTSTNSSQIVPTTNVTDNSSNQSSFVPNAWFADGTPVPVQVPVPRYRIAPYVTPTRFSERLVNFKGIPAILPPDADPDEGIEY